MAGLHLVTGYNGSAHITSADQGVFNAMTMGVGEYVLPYGNKFEAQTINANTVRIKDGSLMMNGRHVILDSGSTLDATISNGTSGMKRHDIIAIRYTTNTNSGVESASLTVIKGAPSASAPTDPTITYPDSILSGAKIHDMPLYRVVLNGLNIESVEPMFRILAPMADIQHGFYKQNLLVNGDFQCDQRGKSSYDATNSVMYTYDMWRAYKVKTERVSDGIKLTGVSADTQGYFTQFIQLGFLKYVPYTISAMVDGKVCTFTLYTSDSVQEKRFGKFKITVLGISDQDKNLPESNCWNNKIKVNICPIGTNSIVINYVDVFEGNIAYPHVKEDYATAMMRCRQYVQAGTQISPFMWYTGNKYHCVLSHEPMAGTPTLRSCSAWYYTTASKYVGCTLAAGNITITLDENNKNLELHSGEYDVNALHLDITTNVSAGTIHERCYGFSLHYFLSCEHAPDGDS